MRLVLRLLLCAGILAVLLVAAAIGDVVFNGRRLFYAALGRDAMIAACRPVLASRLRDEGFEPDDTEFGPDPDILFSTAAGKSLTDAVTFQDGASQTRVDGVVTCAIHDGAVEITVRTAAPPVRAT